MSGTQVYEARKAKGWTQTTMAKKLSVSQGYVSMLESSRRPVPRRLSPKLVSLLRMSASHLPMSNQAEALPEDRVAHALGTLGYPGFAHLAQSKQKVNPAELLVRTLQGRHVEARLVEALPWLLVRFPSLDWQWLVSQAKQHDLQNRLGFVVTVARRLAERHDSPGAELLRKWEGVLEGSRLQKEDTFAGEHLTEAERKWLKTNRSPEAAQWNLLSNVSTETLDYAS